MTSLFSALSSCCVLCFVIPLPPLVIMTHEVGARLIVLEVLLLFLAVPKQPLVTAHNKRLEP